MYGGQYLVRRMRVIIYEYYIEYNVRFACFLLISEEIQIFYTQTHTHTHTHTHVNILFGVNEFPFFHVLIQLLYSPLYHTGVCCLGCVLRMPTPPYYIVTGESIASQTGKKGRNDQ
jgi:hypothetical protein